MKAKLEVLKKLMSQMQRLMANGLGDSSEAGECAMEEMAEPKESIAEAKEEGDDGLKEAVRAAFKPKPKAPVKGAMVVMQSKKQEPMLVKKKGKMNYG